METIHIGRDTYFVINLEAFNKALDIVDFGLEGVARLKSPPVSQPASTESQSTESQSVQNINQRDK